MKITVGKIVWVISILLFLLLVYSQDTFMKLYDITLGNVIEKIHEKTNAEEVNKELPSSTNMSELSFGGGTMEESAPIETPKELNSDFNLQLELLKYKVQELEDDYDKLKVEIKEEREEKKGTMDNLLTILVTLSPVVIPYLTRKTHNKEIKVFNKKKEEKQ